MAYTPTDWSFNDPINEEPMDKLENGVRDAAATADSALSNAASAQSTANSATTAAANAQTAANNASGAAVAANTAAGNAQTAANNAQSTANSALTKANIPGSVYFSGKRMGASTNLAANAFLTFPLDTVDENVGGGSFNAGTGIFTIPVTGRYLCQGSIRIADSAVARSVALGIGTSNVDGSHVAWRNMGGVQRDTFQYMRITTFNAGDLVRLYIYSGSSTFATEYSGGIGNAQFMKLYLLG